MDIPDWLDGNTPLGVHLDIPYRGIFPKSELTQSHHESKKLLDEIMAAGGPGEIVNYRSLEEAGSKAVEEFERLRKEGRIEIVGNWHDVSCLCQHAIATRIAVLVKEKEDGATKVRFVTDMRRSGVNGLVKV